MSLACNVIDEGPMPDSADDRFCRGAVKSLRFFGA
jgi:hypothetical protein